MSNPNSFPDGDLIVRIADDDFDDSKVITLNDDLATISVSSEDETTAHIDGLCVQDGYQELGLARVVFDAAIEYARSNNFTELQATVNNPRVARLLHNTFPADDIVITEYDGALDLPHGDVITPAFAEASLRDAQPTKSAHAMGSLSLHYTVQL